MKPTSKKKKQIKKIGLTKKKNEKTKLSFLDVRRPYSSFDKKFT